MSSEVLHENPSVLSPETIDRHRAIVSLMEELEAIDWYQQRAEAASDPELRAVLEHNRDEEMEHAAMVLEWLRRSWPKAAEQIAAHVNRSGPIVDHGVEGGGANEKMEPPSAADGSLGIGGLKGA